MANESSYESEENDDFEKLSMVDSIADQHQEALDTLVIQLNNLPPDVSEEEIREMFQEYGTIAEPGIVIRHYPGNTAALVNFNSPSVVQNILKSKLTIIIRGFNLTIKAGDWELDSKEFNQINRSPSVQQPAHGDTLTTDIRKFGLRNSSMESINTNHTKKVNDKREISSNVKQRDEDYSSEPAPVKNDQQVHNQKRKQVEATRGDAKVEEYLSRHSNFENDSGNDVKDNYDRQSDKGAVLKVFRQEMKAQGHSTTSETDSTVLFHDTNSNIRRTGNDKSPREHDVNKEVKSYRSVRNQSMIEDESTPTLYHKGATKPLCTKEEKIQKEHKVPKGYQGETGEKTFADDSEPILYHKNRANQNSYRSNREVKTQKEQEEQLNVKKHPKTRSQLSESDSEDNSNYIEQSGDKFLTSSKKKCLIENDYQNKSSRQPKLEKNSSEYLTNKNIEPYVSHRPSRQYSAESDSGSEAAFDESDLDLNSMLHSLHAYNEKTLRRLVKNKIKSYVIHHPSRMVRVASGSDSESSLDDRDLCGKSTVPKHYEKSSRSRAKSNFEPYSDDASSRRRKKLEERDSETSENIVYYNSVEDDCLAQPENTRELNSNVGGYTRRSKNSKRLLEQTKSGSLNYVRNEETPKKKEEDEQRRELMSSEKLKQVHSTTIQIRNVSLLSEELLYLYFKNEHRSHGGKVAKIAFENAYDRAIIDFDNADVAERVLKKNDHFLEGQRLYVSKLPTQCENRFYFENIPKWVTLNLLKIYLEAISQSLIDDIRFGKDNEGAIVSFQNEVFDLQNKINKRPFKDDNGRQMNDVKIHPIVHPDAVLVCGTFPNVDRLIYPIEDFLSNFQDKVSPNIRSVFAKEESNMVLVIFEDYRAVSFLKDSLTIGGNTFSISPFFDHLGWVPQDRKTNVLRECPSSIVTKKLSPLQIEFLSKPVGINFVHAEVDKQQWHCVFEVTEKKVLTVTSETKAISEQITKYILGCMTSIDITLDDAMMKSWFEKGSELQHLVSDNNIRKWFCYSQNKSLLTILAASSEIEVIKQDVERFFNDNAVYEAKIVENEMHGRYLKKFHENDLKLKCLQKCNGIIPFKFNPDGVMIASGTKHQIQIVTTDVNELLSHIQLFRYIIKTPGMASHFQSQAGFIEISMIADKSQTIIDLDYDNKFDANNVMHFNDGVKLEGFLDQKLKFVVVHGDITVQNVDCIVNAANAKLDHIGGVAAAIVKAGGRQIQKECSDFVDNYGPLDVSDVFVSNPGKLPCKKVIHVVGPHWKGGIANEERKLYNAIVSCINTAKSENLCSIAFPAVSTKVFGYPPEKAVPVIIDAIVKTTGDIGPLHEIKLVDLDENTTKLFSKTIANLKGFQDKNQSAISKQVVPKIPSTNSANHLPPRLTGIPSTIRNTEINSNANQDKNIFYYNGCTITLLKDDIVNAAKNCSVIVNSTSETNLLGGNASSRAIATAAGQTYIDEIKQKYPTGLQGATVVKTAAGRLGCHCVYHLACPAWNSATGEKTLRDKIEACLTLLASQQLTSIAFPAIGTGVLNYPARVVAKAIIDTTINWLNKNPESVLKSVVLVVFPSCIAIAKRFEDEFNSRNGISNGSVLNVANSDTIQYGAITVELINGDITKEKTDCVVCPSNAQLDLSQGQVAMALKTAGGQVLENAINASNKSFKKSVLSIPTQNSLSCKSILFVDAPSDNTGRWPDVFMNTLKSADKSNFVSLSVPALGAGTLNLIVDDVADMMLQTIEKFANSNKNLKLIRVVLFQKTAFQEFRQAVSKKCAQSNRASSKKTQKSENLMDEFGESTATDTSDSMFGRAFDWVVKMYKTVVGNKSSAVQEREIEQSITLCICGPSQNVQLASKMLNNTCDEKCPELIVSRDIIGTFDTITIDKLHQQAMTYSVDIEVIREQRKVKVKGYRALDFQNFLTNVLDKMNDELTEVNAKWYKRKDTSSSWDQIKIGVSRLEKEYKRSGSQGCIQFESENDGLVSIDFDKMVILSTAKNILYNLKRLDRSDIPPEWDWDGKCLIDYKLVKLQSNSVEYSTISNAVSQTANVIIEKIERVENPCKYQQYIALKQKMEQSLSGVRGCVAEKYLFHGTGAGNIPGICSDGFNRTLSGQNAVVYGHGSYFARDFSYSARPMYGPTTVFYARVLTGNYTKGTTDMKVAPFVDASKNLKFDSVVDDVKNPSIYVVFSDNHAYPAYVITYKAQ